jgi:hypothetical protein
VQIVLVELSLAERITMHGSQLVSLTLDRGPLP